MRKSALTKIAGIASSSVIWLALAQSALAQTTSTGSASKGGTGSSLPEAGTASLTYMLIIGGVALLVFGATKLVRSFRD